MKVRLAQIGATSDTHTPEQFQKFIRTDNEKWAKLVKERKLEDEIAR